MSGVGDFCHCDFEITAASPERGPFAVGQHLQARVQAFLAFGTKHPLFGIFQTRAEDRLRQFFNFGKAHAAGAPQKIDGCIAGNARKPVGRLLQILQLILPLQRFSFAKARLP